MKRLIFIWLCIIVCLSNGRTQTTGINYQAVARGSDGKELTDQPLNVRFSILKDGINGPIVWQEEHNNKFTNKFGVFNLKVGTGDRTGGISSSFDAIDWSQPSYYLQTEIKFKDVFVDMGTFQMTWVPYALYALKSGTCGSGNIVASFDKVNKKLIINDSELDLSTLSNDGSNSVTNISLNANSLEFQKNGSNYSIDLTKFLDNTNQVLSLDGQKLSISNGNMITLPIRDYQNLSVTGNTLSITNGTSVSFDPNSDNEVQQIKINGDSLIIYRATQPQHDGSVKLPDLYEERDTVYLKGFTKPYKVSLAHTLTKPKPNLIQISRGNPLYVDTDTTNEIQDLNEEGNIISLSNKLNSRKVDLTQNIALNRNQLSIKRGNLIGNTITLDGDTANEIQDLVLNGDKLSITKNVTASSIDLSLYKDNTDGQTISLNTLDTTLSISGGNSLKVNNLMNVPWAGFSAIRTNEFSVGQQDEKLILWETIEFNDNNCFSNSSNAFVAQQTGVYQINFAMKFSVGAVGAVSNTELKVCKYNGISETVIRLINNENISGNLLVKLNQNEQIYLRAKNNNTSIGAMYVLYITQSSFSGYRVH